MAKDFVRVFEVGPRDGLQNEPKLVPLKTKIAFLNDLARAGIVDLEIGAFVRPDRVPQMADTAKIASLKFQKAKTWALVPNQKGLDLALQSKVQGIAVFTAVTDSFTKKNIGMTVAESLKVFSSLIPQAKDAGLQVRGYISTAFHCPFEGEVKPTRALKVIEKLANLGVDQVSIGDTIGKASPRGVDNVVKPAIQGMGENMVAVHFHDTYGMALANTLRSLEWGVRTVDSSAGGLGGCPYAPGASGNLATEDLLWMLDGLGVKTGISFQKVCEASLRLSKTMKRPITSRALQAYVSRCST